jgi:hypothetical protein
MWGKDLSLCRRTTSAQKLPMDYAKMLTAYQWHMITTFQKHHYLQGKTGNTVFFGIPTN